MAEDQASEGVGKVRRAGARGVGARESGRANGTPERPDAVHESRMPEPAPTDTVHKHRTPEPAPTDTAPGHRTPKPAPTDTVREYRMAELARKAGITERTLRFYRERGLIPPPRREGRIAWYDDHHLARLRTISALLERGHTLSGIADLTSAFESGRDAGEALGLVEPTEETPVRLTPEALADHFAGEVTPENLAAALDLGYLAVSGEEIVHISRRLLDVSASLVREGVPLAAVLAAGREVREHADALAALFTDLLRTHAAPEDAERLRPLAKAVVDAELSLALDRRLSQEP